MPELPNDLSSLSSTWPTELRSALLAAEPPWLDHRPQNADLSAAVIAAPDLSPSLRSALDLVAGQLDRSHTISQNLPSAEGSFLHGIMHRREGDYSNAKYWFRRVGTHPVMEQLAADHAEYAGAAAFVDAVANDPKSARLIEVQSAEWRALTRWIADAESV